MSAKWGRVLLKLSGEAFKGDSDQNIDNKTITSFAEQIKQLRELGVELAVVVGGGNFWRGETAEANGFDRVTADYIGMTATNMNAAALKAELERQDVSARVMSKLHTPPINEPYIVPRALRHIEKGRVVILAGGLGEPYFTTDSTAAVRANELRAEVILKGTDVDGIFSADPRTDPAAELFTALSFDAVIAGRYKVMDQTAFTLCRDNNLPIAVFNVVQPGNLVSLVQGDNSIGTLVS